jgi:hypothetical protein
MRLLQNPCGRRGSRPSRCGTLEGRVPPRPGGRRGSRPSRCGTLEGRVPPRPECTGVLQESPIEVPVCGGSGKERARPPSSQPYTHLQTAQVGPGRRTGPRSHAWLATGLPPRTARQDGEPAVPSLSCSCSCSCSCSSSSASWRLGVRYSPVPVSACGGLPRERGTGYPAKTQRRQEDRDAPGIPAPGRRERRRRGGISPAVRREG